MALRIPVFGSVEQNNRLAITTKHSGKIFRTSVA